MRHLIQEQGSRERFIGTPYTCHPAGLPTRRQALTLTSAIPPPGQPAKCSIPHPRAQLRKFPRKRSTWTRTAGSRDSSTLHGTTEGACSERRTRAILQPYGIKGLGRAEARRLEKKCGLQCPAFLVLSRVLGGCSGGCCGSGAV